MPGNAVLVPLAVVVPLGSAALMAAVSRLLPSLLRDAVALGSAAATAAVDGLLLVQTSGVREVYWYAGWRPAHGFAIGVDYAVGPLGAGFALLSSVLAAVALVYSRSFFDEMGGRYPALVLVFVAGMTDFALSGDLFNMFVGFELVAITAVVLTGFFAEDEAPLQGAINFAVTATVATLLFLVAIALLYDRTETLNLADMGRVLAGHRLGGAAVVGFALLAAAFLTKAAVVPFHFWLPDAYGTAPVPACVLFAGVMSEMGIFGLARVWTSVFSGAHAPSGTTGLSAGLGALGAVTAVVGAVMAARQRPLRRLLAFVTVAHSGLYLLGFSLLSAVSTGAVAILVVGDGFAKAGMFLAAGVAHQHTAPSPGDGEVPSLTGGGVASLVVLVAGAVTLADLPPFATADGKDLLVAAAGHWGSAVEVLYALTVIVSSAAVVDTALRRYREGQAAGAGARAGSSPADEDDEQHSDEEERAGSGRRGAARLLAPAGGLVLASLAVGLVPGLDHGVLHASAMLFDRRAYDAAVAGRPVPPVATPAVPPTTAGAVAVDVAEAASAVVLGVLLASRARVFRSGRELAAMATGWLRRLHTGHVGDQIAWQTAGAAALAALAGLALR